MENRTALLIGGIALGVAVGTVAVRPSGTATDSLGSGRRARDSVPLAAARDAGYHRGTDLLQEFFGASEGPTRPGAPKPYALEVLIASLPDPYESHLDWSFDAQIESIRRAFEASGYVTDRFWLPSSRDSAGSGDARRPISETAPGVFLFRGADPARRSLRLLYLIGELPTAGMHKSALLAALQERQALYNRPALPVTSPRSRHLAFIGPTFSGSALSLRQALLGGLGAGDTVDLVSGSATDLRNLQTLTNDSGVVLRFAATVHPDNDLNEALERLVLKPLGFAPSEVALLRESSTQYGTSVAGRQGYLDVPFPMSISSLRSEYVRSSGGAGTTGTPPSLPSVTAASRLPLNLQDGPKPREDLPLTSELSPPAIDLVLDEIARTLARHRIRMVGLLATDVRDKLFLGEELRKRMRDVQLFTFENSILYLRPEENTALRGMLVLSTYPLATESQWWNRRSGISVRLSFPTDAAEGVYNATLYQLGNPGAMLDYDSPADSVTSGRPVVWLSTVGSSAFLPLAQLPRSNAGDCYLATKTPALARTPCLLAPPIERLEKSPRPRSTSALPFLAIVVSAVVLGLIGWFTWSSDQSFPGSHRGRLTPTAGLGIRLTKENDEARSILPRVLEGSLLIHQRLYQVLALLAVLGVFLDVSVLRVRLWTAGRSGISLWLLLAVTVAVASLAPLVRALRSGLRLCRSYSLDGWRYGFRLRWGSTADRALWRLEIVGRSIVAIFGSAYLAMTLWFIAEVWSLGEPGNLRFSLFIHRANQIGSLTSPLLPLLLAGMGYATWCAWHMRRIALLQISPVFEQACAKELTIPTETRGTLTAALRDDLRRAALGAERVRWRLFLVMPSPGALALLLVLGMLLAWLWGQFLPTFETIALASHAGGQNAFDWLLKGSICATLFATAWATFRFLVVWDALDGCLDAVQAMPMVTAFDRLPPRVTRLTRFKLPGLSENSFVGAVTNRQWMHLRGIYFAKTDEFDAQLGNSPLRQGVDSLMLRTGVRDSATLGENTTDQAKDFGALHELLREFWSAEPMTGRVEPPTPRPSAEPAAGGAPSVASPSTRVRRTFTGGVELWVQAAEEFVAVQIVDYVEWVIRHLRILALFLLLSLVITTLLLSGYPFMPRQLVKLCFIVLLLATVAAMLYVNTQMNRNEVLSRIAKTEPGKISWDATFVSNLFTFGAIPILTLLSSEFPGLRTTLFSWAEPLLKVLLKQ